MNEGQPEDPPQAAAAPPHDPPAAPRDPAGPPPGGDDEVEIREIELEDLAPIYNLGERLFTADRWTTLHRTWDEYAPVDLFAADRETCLVADQGGRLVGFALGTLIEKRRSAWTYGYLLWLGVEPELKGTGIGSRLMQHLERRFIDHGARMMLVDTAAENLPARAFFRRHGFGRDEAHVYLAKNLTRAAAYRRRHPSRRKGQLSK